MFHKIVFAPQEPEQAITKRRKRGPYRFTSLRHRQTPCRYKPNPRLAIYRRMIYSQRALIGYPFGLENWRFSNLDTYTLPYTFPDFSPETLQIYCKNTKQHYFTAENRAKSKAGATQPLRRSRPAPARRQAWGYCTSESDSYVCFIA